MKRFFVRRGSQESGPHPVRVIRRLAAEGGILQTDELREDGSERYIRASSIRGLFETPSDTPTGTASPRLPPLLPVTKSTRAVTPPMQTPQLPALPAAGPQHPRPARSESGSLSSPTKRPHHAFLRFLGYTLIVAAGATWFVVEPMTREPLKGTGFEKTARWLKGDNENTPVKMLSLCIAIGGVVCLVKSSGRGLTEVSTPEQLGLAYDPAQDHLFPVACSSGGKHEDAILGLLLIRTNDVLFRPDRLNPLQNNQEQGVNFLRSMLSARAFAVDVGHDWLVRLSVIQKVTRSGWMIRSVRVVTAQEVHGRTVYYFYGSGRKAFSRQAQDRLIECFAAAIQRTTRH